MTIDEHAGEISSVDQPFQSLYRRYRPQRFSSVLGQNHVTLALRNAVRDAHVAHAYLFSGPRGTGKTSTARIMAKALNCAAPDEGEPCDVCESCVAIRAGSSFDVHELDAASNNGVDAMRDLVGRAALSTPGRWKVYIVDEVHMLSAPASNALLKTLEEPPDHVVFVLATTDPQRVLPTIRSRTQHFEFHLIGEETLTHLLDEVAAAAHLELPAGAVALATRRAKGSARDALSVLDQVAASGVAEDDNDTLAAVIGALIERDPARGLGAIDEAIRSGRDPQQLAIELVDYLRAGFLALVAPRAGEDASAQSSEVAHLGTAACVRAMDLIGTAIVAMRDAPEPRVTLEVAIIRLVHPDADDSPVAFLERLERLERRVEELGGRTDVLAAPAKATAAPPARTRPAPDVATPEESSPEAPPSGSGASEADGEVDNAAETPAGGPATARLALGAYTRRERASERPATPTPDSAATPTTSPPAAAAPPAAEEVGGELPARDDLVAAWGDGVLAALRPRSRAVFQAGRFVAVEDGAAVFALPNAAHLEHATPLRDEVSAALSAHFGTRVPLRLVTEHGLDKQPIDADDADSDTEETLLATERTLTGDPVSAEETEREGISLAEHRLLEAFPGAELESS